MKTFGWLVCLTIAVAGGSRFDLQDRAPNVSLTARDIRGRDHTPFKLDGSKASVLIFLAHDCPVSNRYAPELQRIARDYRDKQIRFYLVYVDPTVGSKQIEGHLREYGLSDIPAIQDARRALVKAAGATVTPEAAVVGEKGAILYRGRIDNLYAALGKPRRQATERDLRNALDAILKGEKIPVARTQAIGCYIASQR